MRGSSVLVSGWVPRARAFYKNVCTERQSARAEAEAKAMQVDAPTGGDAAKRSKAEAGVKTPTKPPPTSSEGSWTPAGKLRIKALPLPQEVRKLELTRSRRPGISS